MKIFKNKRHTALEILQATAKGYKMGKETWNPEDVAGKARVRIAGIVVASNDHMIKLPNAKSIELIVGIEKYKLELDKSDKKEVVLTKHALEVNKNKLVNVRKKDA